MKKSKSAIGVVIVLAGVLIISAYALTQITTQTIPSVGLSAGLYSNCTTLVATYYPTQPTNSRGFVDFKCSLTSNIMPLNVTDASYAYTPTFTLPAPYVSLNATYNGNTVGCARFSTLTSGQGFTFPCVGTG